MDLVDRWLIFNSTRWIKNYEYNAIDAYVTLFSTPHGGLKTQDVEVKRERVFCGVGMYVLRKEGGRSVLEVKVGTESNVVECGEGEDVVDVLKRLFGMDVEIKKVERVGGVEKGFFGLYAEV